MPRRGGLPLSSASRYRPQPPGPEAMAQKHLRATEEMQITLLRLRDEFGVDVSSALLLQGPELGSGWIGLKTRFFYNSWRI